MGVNTLGEIARKVIPNEERRRKEVGDDLGSGFAEWQRGLCAALSQLAAASSCLSRYCLKSATL